MHSNLKLAIIFILFILFCTKHEYNPRLVDYLKAEKYLRKRIIKEQELSDSITTLQKKYRIDLEKELSKLRDNPEAWLKLLEELKGEK